MTARQRIAHYMAASAEPNTQRLEEAAWWLTRWISGSMDDPDWDDSWTTMDVSTAFRIIADTVGNRLSASKPILWRFVWLTPQAARRVVADKLLPPNPKFAYQSFTGARQIAEEDGPTLGRRPMNTVGVLVSAKPKAGDIMFGMADLKRSQHPPIRDVLIQLGDWHHQDEVLVNVTKPLPLISAMVLEAHSQRSVGKGK